MWSLFLFFATHFLFQSCIGQNCIYSYSPDNGATTYTMYLDALEHATLTHTADKTWDTSTYTFTPCRNAAGECKTEDGSTDTSMCKQSDETDPNTCYVVANVDATVMPTYAGNATVGTWQFLYSNGDDTGCTGESARDLEVNLICDMSAGDYTIIDAYEEEDGVKPRPDCSYIWIIKTQWACPGMVYSPESSTLSGGTIFCIILGSVVFAYFIFGWCLCAVLNRKDRGFGDVIGNIPHVTFWTKLPALTFAGCCFTKDFLLGLCGKGGANSSGNEIIDD